MIKYLYGENPFYKNQMLLFFSKGNELKAKYQTHHLRKQINNYENILFCRYNFYAFYEL